MKFKLKKQSISAMIFICASIFPWPIVSSWTQHGQMLSFQNNAVKLAEEMREFGLPDLSIAAVLGNFAAESGLNPYALQGNDLFEALYVPSLLSGRISEESFCQDQRGFGLAQWTHPERKQNLHDFSAANKFSASSQIQFFFHELEQPEYAVLRSALMNPDGCSLEELTILFHDSYERSADHSMEYRIALARAMNVFLQSHQQRVF